MGVAGSAKQNELMVWWRGLGGSKGFANSQHVGFRSKNAMDINAWSTGGESAKSKAMSTYERLGVRNQNLWFFYPYGGNLERPSTFSLTTWRESEKLKSSGLFAMEEFGYSKTEVLKFVCVLRSPAPKLTFRLNLEWIFEDKSYDTSKHGVEIE